MTRPRPTWTHLAYGLATTVFAVDLMLPLGVASAIPYTFAVLLALKDPRPWIGPFVAGACIVLTVAKMGIAPDRGTTELWKVIANRCLAIFSIGMTTFLGMRRRRADFERAAAEEKLRLHLADLAHLNRLATAGQLATGLAHELNQPLAAVCLNADIAAQSPTAAADPSLAEALCEISEQSQRAAEIIKSVRRMVGKGAPVEIPVDLNAVVRGVATVVAGPARRAGVAVEMHLAADPLPAVLGDPTQLEQVVHNLVQNAVEAVEAADSGPRLVEIVTVAENAAVAVTVRDTGVGLPSNSEILFERFRTTKPAGMGLGLALARSIVEAHGGRVWASPRSGPNRGAEFTFRLPVSKEAP